MRTRWMAALAALVLPLPAAAQVDRLPPAVAARIAAMGPVWTPEVNRETRALFAAIPNASTEGLTVTKDVPYGPDARHLLDVYVPATAAAGSRPVLLFVHGGGFVRGEREANIPAYAARNGMVGVSMTYRLAPAHPYPAGARDVGAAVAWVRANAARLGADPARIVVFGHSAGATHVASWAMDPAVHPAEGPGIAGAILGSGLLRMAAEREDRSRNESNRAYFGDDEALYAARSPMTHVPRGRVPVLLFNGEFDPANLAAPTVEMASLICWRDGRCPRLVQLRGHNHLSEIIAIGTADDELGGEILRFVRDPR